MKGEMNDMMSNMKQPIRECYDEFLDAVTEDWDLWEIALLEHDSAPLERQGMEQSIPDCFADLASRVPRLVKRKEELRSDGGSATAQARLEERYGWDPLNASGRAAKKLPAQAIALLVMYHLLAEARSDHPGGLHTPFPEGDALKRILENGVETPKEKTAMALRLQALAYRWHLDGEELDWLVDLMKELLESALRGDCGDAGWHLYELLWAHDRFGDPREALELLREAAQAGSVDAQMEIGRQFYIKVMELDWELSVMGYCGDGISGEDAVYWLEQALPYRIEAAPFLARLLLEGKGVPTDEKRAVCVLTVAVENYYAGKTVFLCRNMCLRMLADCYMTGRGVPKDRRKATLLYKKAFDVSSSLLD